MPSNKDRLYVALYDREEPPTMPGKEDTYHWALVVGPKIVSDADRGFRFYAKDCFSFSSGPPDALTTWHYESEGTSLAPSSMLLVCIAIGKIKNIGRLRDLLENGPLKGDIEGWNCVQWVKESLLTVFHDGKSLGKSATNWHSVRDTAMWYVGTKKAARRFEGEVNHDFDKAPAWDMLEGVELNP